MTKQYKLLEHGGLQMKNLSSKVVKNAYRVIEDYKAENEGRNYSLSSLISYCIESDIRTSLKEKKFKDNEIDSIFSALDLNVKFQIRDGSVKFDVVYR